MNRAVRKLVNKGRVMPAVERYKEGKASLGLAAELADLTLGEMINTLAEYGVQSNLETEDYLKGLTDCDTRLICSATGVEVTYSRELE